MVLKAVSEILDGILIAVCNNRVPVTVNNVIRLAKPSWLNVMSHGITKTYSVALWLETV